MEQKAIKGELFLVLATLCWSLSGVLTKSLSISPILSNALRSVLAVGVLLVFNRFRVRVNKTIFLAAICSALTTILFFVALSLTAAANAVVIQYTAPIFVLVFTCVQARRSPRISEVLVVLAAFVGVAIVFSADLSGGNMWGNLCALGAGLAFAGVYFINRQPGASSVDSSIVAFSICTVTGFFYIGQLPGMSAKEWGAVLIMGLIQHGLAYVFFSIGISRCSGFSASLIGMLEIVLVPFWVFLAFRELPSSTALWGSSLIITAVILNILYTRRLERQGENLRG